MVSNIIYIYEWLSFGPLGNGVSRGGLLSLRGVDLPSFLYWSFATYTRDAIYMLDNRIDNRAWLPYGFANGIFLDGLYSLLGNTWLGGTAHYFATLLSLW